MERIIGKVSSDIVDAVVELLDRGFQQGLKKGLEQGRTEGFETCQKALLRALEGVGLILEVEDPVSTNSLDQDIPVQDLGMSNRTTNKLLYANILLIRQLVAYSGSELLKIWNFGPKCLSEVEESLQELNLTLKKEGN